MAVSGAIVTWVLEHEVFLDVAAFADAVRAAGHDVVRWRDAWLAQQDGPVFAGHPVVFRGSLGNAAEVVRKLPWRPGAYCDTEAFRCSTWYPGAARWLVNAPWSLARVDALIADPYQVLAAIGGPSSFFVRPDSPLKPFAGRVLARERLSLEALDHGYYHDDTSLPIVVAPARRLGREWRYVVVGRRVVAGSAYEAEGRAALADDPAGAPWRYAESVAADLAPPEEVYVLDVCEADGDLRLLELNPFSGADLYGCDRRAVIDAVSAAARSDFRG